MSRFGVHPHTFCHFCGESLRGSVPHDGGRRCIHCQSVVYENPTPVGVLIIPTGRRSILAIRRAIEPCRGMIALPGGFVVKGETWQQAAVREAGEETGCVIRDNPTEWPKLFHAESTPDGNHVIIVGTARAFSLGPFQPTSEALEVLEYTPTTTEKLCFPIHQNAVDLYFG